MTKATLIGADPLRLAVLVEPLEKHGITVEFISAGGVGDHSLGEIIFVLPDGGPLPAGQHCIVCNDGDARQCVQLMELYPAVDHFLAVGEDFDPRCLERVLASVTEGKVPDPTTYVSEELVEETINSYSTHRPYLDRFQEHADRVLRLPDFGSTMTTIVWELLTNAIFDAPIDPATNEPKYRRARKDRELVLQPDERVTLRYGRDQDCYMVCVRDQFGSLKKEALLASLSRCLKRVGQVGVQPSGAGVGMFMVLNAVSSVEVVLVPDQYCEMILTVPMGLSPKKVDQRPKSFHFYIKGKTQETDVKEAS